MRNEVDLFSAVTSIIADWSGVGQVTIDMLPGNVLFYIYFYREDPASIIVNSSSDRWRWKTVTPHDFSLDRDKPKVALLTNMRALWNLNFSIIHG